MRYKVTPTSKYKKDFKRATARGLNIKLLDKVINTLAQGLQLDPKYKDHSLIGDYEGFRECHIQPDWLLVYRIEEDKLILILQRTGSHSDLF